jgi:hypothetical protein
LDEDLAADEADGGRERGQGAVPAGRGRETIGSDRVRGSSRVHGGIQDVQVACATMPPLGVPVISTLLPFHPFTYGATVRR